MTRHDTTPTPAERDRARADMARACCNGLDDRSARAFYAMGWLCGVINDVTEVDDPETARLIARARAVCDAYKEAW
jgi:hypothetical protein